MPQCTSVYFRAFRGEKSPKLNLSEFASLREPNQLLQLDRLVAALRAEVEEKPEIGSEKERWQ